MAVVASDGLTHDCHHASKNSSLYLVQFIPELNCTVKKLVLYTVASVISIIETAPEKNLEGYTCY